MFRMAILYSIPSIIAVLFVSTQAARIAEQDGKIESFSGRPEERCNRFGDKPLKQYHFELLLSGNRTMTAHFARDPERPTMSMSFGTVWSAWLPAPWFTTENDAEVVWQAITDDSAERATAQTYDLIEHYVYVRRVRFPREPGGSQRPNGIELHFANGLNASFAGGAYFPNRITKDSLNAILRRELADELDPADANETTRLLHGVRGNLPDETAAPSRDSMIGIRAKEMEQNPTSLLTAASPFFSVVLGAVSVASGTVSTSIVTTISSGYEGLVSLDRYFDDRRQMNYAASEKLFDKLWCHPRFTQCQATNGDDIVVPPGRECPDV